jgi:hypothetical protein
MRFAFILACLTITLADSRADTFRPDKDAELVKDGLESTKRVAGELVADPKTASKAIETWAVYTSKEAFVWDGGPYGLGKESDGDAAPCVKIGARGVVKDANPAKAEPIMRCFGEAIGSADTFTWAVITAKDLPKSLATVKARVTSLLKSGSTSTPHVFVLGTRASAGSVGKEYVLAGWHVQHGWTHWALTTLAFASDPVLD